jgi:hypothetical protein
VTTTGPEHFQGLEWARVEKILRSAMALMGSIKADIAVYPMYSIEEREEQEQLRYDAFVKAAALEVILDAHPWLAEALAEAKPSTGA